MGRDPYVAHVLKRAVFAIMRTHLRPDAFTRVVNAARRSACAAACRGKKWIEFEYSRCIIFPRNAFVFVVKEAAPSIKTEVPAVGVDLRAPRG